jgi:hypothetical protein
MIVAKKFGTNNEWLYDSDKFIDRKACMSEIYLDMKEDGKVGSFHIELLPCDRQGIAYDNIEKFVIHEPERQLKKLYFLIRMNNFKCVAGRYKVKKL